MVRLIKIIKSISCVHKPNSKAIQNGGTKMEHQEEERQLMLLSIQHTVNMGNSFGVRNNHLLDYVKTYSPKMYDLMVNLLQYPSQQRDQVYQEKLQKFKTQYPDNVMFI